MSLILGKDVWLYALDSDNVLKAIACSRECSLTTNMDTSETSTRGTGIWKTFRGDRLSWSISTSGFESFDTNLSVSKLRLNWQFTLSRLFISFRATDQNGKIENYNGWVLLPSITTAAAYDGLFGYDITLQGDGELVITDIPFDPNELTGKLMIYPYDGTGAETGGNELPHISALDGKEVLWLARDGWEFRKVNTMPTGKQFIFELIDPLQAETTDNYRRIVFAEDIPPIQPAEMIDIYYRNI